MKIEVSIKKEFLMAFSYAICLLFGCSNIFAQDIIVTKKSQKIEAKITEVEQDEIKYKNFSYLEGPTYTIKKSEIASIIYQNGDVETFSETPQKKQQEYKEIDIYNVINNPSIFFPGECTHLKGFEESSTSRISTSWGYWGGGFGSFGGRSVDRTYYNGYIFCEHASKIKHEEMYYKINQNQAIFLSPTQFKNFLKTHDYELYKMYMLGRNLYISGWVVSGIGWAADFCTLICMMVDFYGLQDLILPMGIVGAVCTATGVSMLISGAVIKNRKVPALYNKKYSKGNETSMTWNLGIIGNGMGLQLKF